MLSGNGILFVAVGAGSLLMARRHLAFQLRSDFWAALTAIFVLPALGLLIVWPDCPESYVAALLAPAFLMGQYALYLATVREAQKLRALRREIPRWHLFTGTAPAGVEISRLTAAHSERRLGWRTLSTVGAIASVALLYTVICFGWSSLVIVPVLFWSFMALYQFTFSPDN